jgi:hypothetical protein
MRLANVFIASGGLMLIPTSNFSFWHSRHWCGPLIYRATIAIFSAALVGSAAANPLIAPTVGYVADFEITRDSDHSFQVPARYVYAGRRIRVEFVGIVHLIDLDLRNVATMIPRVKTYWAPVPLPKPPADGRRWVGVEAETAEVIGTDTLLGRAVTKYWVRGTIFEVRTPFEGYVWTTAENIVLRVDGVGRADGISTPIKVTPVQLVVGPVDASLLTVPSNFARAGPSDVGWRQTD